MTDSRITDPSTAEAVLASSAHDQQASSRRRSAAKTSRPSTATTTSSPTSTSPAPSIRRAAHQNTGWVTTLTASATVSARLLDIDGRSPAADVLRARDDVRQSPNSSNITR